MQLLRKISRKNQPKIKGLSLSFYPTLQSPNISSKLQLTILSAVFYLVQQKIMSSLLKKESLLEASP
jgi:hypothetical protein